MQAYPHQDLADCHCHCHCLLNYEGTAAFLGGPRHGADRRRLPSYPQIDCYQQQGLNLPSLGLSGEHSQCFCIPGKGRGGDGVERKRVLLQICVIFGAVSNITYRLRNLKIDRLDNSIYI